MKKLKRKTHNHEARALERIQVRSYNQLSKKFHRHLKLAMERMRKVKVLEVILEEMRIPILREMEAHLMFLRASSNLDWVQELAYLTLLVSSRGQTTKSM